MNVYTCMHMTFQPKVKPYTDCIGVSTYSQLVSLEIVIIMGAVVRMVGDRRHNLVDLREYNIIWY